ncbi:hypothetical protein SPRG_11380 [Saprolegnia parasitica CBS 223.65]|uniref:Uncharacterized protein n=1 Tax=Saprolegnia parasitica (strain CBS 223.65) TaxID=695850 RepID=A0A067C9G1_SAPPC|nr:hypothetical protein SPRG_11380 [Saprolegnia parasitica CBS 223.65]KDO23457.1 hypothetical protein SPRG_11380 [Saprolegnia parasitica CBS 223.65]|eukprot:XP_012205774.1 hypothetical protein SPRG_11380 [Saprolegnia parasitica CBS 223.65]
MRLILHAMMYYRQQTSDRAASRTSTTRRESECKPPMRQCRPRSALDEETQSCFRKTLPKQSGPTAGSHRVHQATTSPTIDFAELTVSARSLHGVYEKRRGCVRNHVQVRCM